jgi:hypothetical protein
MAILTRSQALLPRFFLSQFLCQVYAPGIDRRSQREHQLDVRGQPLFIEWADSHHATMISFEASSHSTPPAVFFWTRKPGLNNLSATSSWRVWLPYGNCATVLLLCKSSGGVLMIPEVSV